MVLTGKDLGLHMAHATSLADKEMLTGYYLVFDRERAMYSSDEKDEFWKKQGELAALRQISVDFFICGNYFSDVATTNQLCTASGGQTYYYPSWRMEPGSNNEEAGLKLRKELGHNLQRLQVGRRRHMSQRGRLREIGTKLLLEGR